MTPTTREQRLAELVSQLDVAMALHSQGRIEDAERALVSAGLMAESLGLPRRGWTSAA